MIDRIEHPQAGVGTVARHQNHLDPGAAKATVEVEQFFHQRKGIARREDFVFVLDLILPIGFDAARQVDLVTLAQIEQGTGRNRQHQFVIDVLGHAFPQIPSKNRLRCYAGR